MKQDRPARKVSANQKKVWLSKYKMARNQVNSNIRKKSTDFNNNRINEAGNENEVWNVPKDIITTQWLFGVTSHETLRLLRVLGLGAHFPSGCYLPSYQKQGR